MHPLCMTAHTISIVQTPNYEPTFFTLIGFLLALKSAVRDVVQPEITKVIIIAKVNNGGHQI